MCIKYSGLSFYFMSTPSPRFTNTLRGRMCAPRPKSKAHNHHRVSITDRGCLIDFNKGRY